MTTRTLGDFKLGDVIGAGGFGEVYRAEQIGLGREAVVKLLQQTHRASQSAIQRFLREARLASQLDHPYAAHVYAFGAEADGTLWIAMELVRGTTLQQILELQGALPVERFVPLLEKISQVVHTAHEQGIVHRDIKPANVMVIARAGQLLPKLLDLGVARALIEDEPAAPVPTTTEEAEAASPITRDAAAIGSPPYMAPEQWIHAASAGASADIYSLGVLAYEALTGKTPFRSRTLVGMARAHATKAVPALGPGFPAELDAVIARAMAKAPHDRFPDALAFAAAVRAAALPGTEPIAVPRLDAAAVRSFVDAAPQPLAEAIAGLDAAHTPRQARDAFWNAIRLIARLLGIYALAARSRVGAGGDADAPEVIEALQALKRRGLSDVEWLDLARGLARRFVTCRDAHPIPELVALFFSQAGEPTAAAEQLRDLAARTGATDAAVGETEVATQLAAMLPALERVLAAIGFMTTYPMVVARTGDRIEKWSGARRVPRPTLAASRPGRLPVDQVALVDAAGVPVVSLAPLAQVLAPIPGADPELFVLAGPGARGARLVAPPHGYEHADDTVWDWFREHLAAGAGPAGTRATSADDRPPYLGLATFTTRDAGVFFGREREAEQVANRLKTRALVAVVGPSGAGKSSFVQAGVLPLLPDPWRAIVVRPGAQPLAALAARLATAGITVAPTGDAVIRDVPPAVAASGRPLVIVIDQFEEVLTLCRDPAERQAFVDALTRVAPSADAPIRVICTLRDDFLMRIEQLVGMRDAFAAGLVLLGTPSLDDLLRIVIEPGRRAGYEFEDPELAREMAKAVADRPGALPLLSFTAARLWELRDRHFHQLPRKAYVAMGGVGGALAQHAESTFTAMVADEQRLCREAFRHLVTADGTRAVLSRGELEQVTGGGAIAPVVIDRLIDARLLVASEDETGGDRIEIVHETLIEEWPRLRGWRHDDAEGARLRDQLRQAARQWHDRGRPRGMLWRAEALAEFRIWRSRFPGTLTETEDAFARASEADEARGRRVRRLVTAIGFVVLVIAIAILVRANRRADDERAAAQTASEQASGRLAENYFDRGRQAVLAGDPMRALIYLDEAARLGIHGPAEELLVAQAAASVESVRMVIASGKGKMWVARYTPDGRSIVTGGEDGVVRIWDATTGALQRELPGHTKDVFDVAFAPDGGAMASASQDGTARLWALPAGAPIATLAHTEWVVGVKFLPAIDAIGTSSLDRTLKLWRATDGAPIATIGPVTAPMSQFAVSPDGTMLATTAFDGGAALWDARTHAKLRDLVGHTGLVFSAAFSPDGTKLATACWDHTAAIWDVATGRRLALLQGHSAEIDQVAWSPSGDRVATASRDATARIWAADGRLVHTLTGHKSTINSIVWSADGERILTASSDSTAKLWSARVGALIESLDGHTTGVYRATFAAGERAILTGSWDGTARVWTPSKGALVATFGGAGHVTDAEPCGDRAITAGADRTARVWDRETGAELYPIGGHGDAVVTASCNAAGTRGVTASADGTARMFDVATGQIIATLAGGDQLVAARIAADGRVATIGGTGAITIWDPAGAKLTTIDAGHPLVDAVWSDDGALLLARGPHAALVWDSRSQTVWSREDVGKAALNAARFARNATLVVIGSDDRHARVFDARTGRLVRDFVHDAIVLSVRASPDGTKLAAAIEDGRTAMWNLDTGERLGTLERHNGEVEDAAFTPDSNFIVTGGTEGVVKVWDVAGLRELAAFPSNLGGVMQVSVWPDGTRILARDDQDGIYVWRLERDPRTAKSLDSMVKCFVPLALHNGTITPATPDPTPCLNASR